MQPIFSILIGGILPFGAVFIELFFILTSMWLHQVYYIFGVLFIVFLILVITCAEITIVLCYFQLCSEDYHWWWRAFFTSGSSAVYMFLYSAFYFVTKLEITKLVSTLMYFGCGTAEGPPGWPWRTLCNRRAGVEAEVGNNLKGAVAQVPGAATACRALPSAPLAR